jgi:inhibitor of KinA
MIYERPRFLPGGDSSLFVEFGDAIYPELNRRVRRLQLAIQEAGLPGVVEVVPTYRSLLVCYGPAQISPAELRARLEVLAGGMEARRLPEPIVTEIPTAYGGEYGPDLGFVAEHNGLSPQEVIEIHASKAYLIYMLGFIPGFAYLGGMSPRIATPRLATPRVEIPAGSVGIAGSQTGVYPAESPGGWRIIGRTPIELFHPHREPPAMLRTGNYVRFVPMTAHEFERVREEVKLGVYRVKETRFVQEDVVGDT